MKTERQIRERIQELFQELVDEKDDNKFVEQNLLGRIRSLNWVLE